MNPAFPRFLPETAGVIRNFVSPDFTTYFIEDAALGASMRGE
jgi:hypothetical protein